MRLKIITNDGYPARYHSFLDAREISIGRSRHCEIVLDDASVARRHCLIEEKDGRLRIADLRSSQGTYVNGQKVSKHFLNSGDAIMVGVCTLLWLWYPAEPEPTPEEGEIAEASSQSTEAPRLSELAREMWTLARVVAKNPSAPPELMEWLGRGYDRPTWEALAQNPSTPMKLLLEAGEHAPHKLLENPVFPLLLLEKPGLFMELPFSVFQEMFCRSRVEGRPLEMFLRHPTEQFREWAKRQLSFSKFRK